jgi:hypothetical protein
MPKRHHTLGLSGFKFHRELGSTVLIPVDPNLVLKLAPPPNEEISQARITEIARSGFALANEP